MALKELNSFQYRQYKPLNNRREIQIELQAPIQQHIRLLGHHDLGVNELRVFKPRPLVAYVDNPQDVVRLVREMDGYAHGIYIGVQPRPLRLFDKAPNRWVKAPMFLTYFCSI